MSLNTDYLTGVLICCSSAMLMIGLVGFCVGAAESAFVWTICAVMLSIIALMIYASADHNKFMENLQEMQDDG